MNDILQFDNNILQSDPFPRNICLYTVMIVLSWFMCNKKISFYKLLERETSKIMNWLYSLQMRDKRVISGNIIVTHYYQKSHNIQFYIIYK